MGACASDNATPSPAAAKRPSDGGGRAYRVVLFGDRASGKTLLCSRLMHACAHLRVPDAGQPALVPDRWGSTKGGYRGMSVVWQNVMFAFDEFVEHAAAPRDTPCAGARGVASTAASDAATTTPGSAHASDAADAHGHANANEQFVMPEMLLRWSAIVLPRASDRLRQLMGPAPGAYGYDVFERTYSTPLLCAADHGPVERAFRERVAREVHNDYVTRIRTTHHTAADGVDLTLRHVVRATEWIHAMLSAGVCGGLRELCEVVQSYLPMRVFPAAYVLHRLWHHPAIQHAYWCPPDGASNLIDGLGTHMFERLLHYTVRALNAPNGDAYDDAGLWHDLPDSQAAAQAAAERREVNGYDARMARERERDRLAAVTHSVEARDDWASYVRTGGVIQYDVRFTPHTVQHVLRGSAAKEGRPATVSASAGPVDDHPLAGLQVWDLGGESNERKMRWPFAFMESEMDAYVWAASTADWDTACYEEPTQISCAHALAIFSAQYPMWWRAQDVTCYLVFTKTDLLRRKIDWYKRHFRGDTQAVCDRIRRGWPLYRGDGSAESVVAHMRERYVAALPRADDLAGRYEAYVKANSERAYPLRVPPPRDVPPPSDPMPPPADAAAAGGGGGGASSDARQPVPFRTFEVSAWESDADVLKVFALIQSDCWHRSAVARHVVKLQMSEPKPKPRDDTKSAAK